MSLAKEDENVVVIPEDVDFSNLRDLIEKHVALQFVGAGESVLVNFGWRSLSEEQIKELLKICSELYITLDGIISFSSSARTSAEKMGVPAIIGRMGISNHYSRFINIEPQSSEPKQKSKKKPELMEETVMFRRNLLNEEVLEVRGNVVIQGDIERGAQVIAGGDIVVLGTITGEAHAGSKGNLKSQIICLVMAPICISIAGINVPGEQIVPMKKGYLTRVFVEDKSLKFKPYRV